MGIGFSGMLLAVMADSDVIPEARLPIAIWLIVTFWGLGFLQLNKGQDIIHIEVKIKKEGKSE
jgi:hypothetical protein